MPDQHDGSAGRLSGAGDRAAGRCAGADARRGGCTQRDLGDARMANVVMLGALSTLLPIEREIWDKTLRLRIPAKYLDGNLKAFQSGYEAMQKTLQGGR